MLTHRESWDRDANDLLAFAADNLPDGQEVSLTIVRGECRLSLEEDGRDVEVCCDDLDFVGSVIAHVNKARRRAGLESVTWGDSDD